LVLKNEEYWNLCSDELQDKMMWMKMFQELVPNADKKEEHISAAAL